MTVVSFASEMIVLLLGHTCFSWAVSGTIVHLLLWHDSVVSVNPIIVGSRSAALLNRSFQRIRFVGRPFMFCMTIRSWCGGLGTINVGPHVVLRETVVVAFWHSVLVCGA